MMRLLSVPHTGTRFMRQTLENAGYVRTQAFWGNGDFIQVHFDGKHNQPIIWRENGLVIIPLRDRQEVEQSWKRRGRPLSDLREMWGEMEAFVEWYDKHIYFIHVDDPNRREDELQALSEKLGTILIADFNEKVGHGE